MILFQDSWGVDLNTSQFQPSAFDPFKQHLIGVLTILIVATTSELPWNEQLSW